MTCPGCRRSSVVRSVDNAAATFCLSVSLLACIGALYLLLYDGNERRRFMQRVQRWQRHVAERLIEACARLDYPAGQLEM